MNLLFCTIHSSARFAGFAGWTAALLLGCGGSAPPQEREQTRELSKVESQNQAGEKGAGGINFHFANKTTDAHMSIDLGSTEVYLEMSGRPANAEDETAMQPFPQKERGKSSSKNRNEEPTAQSSEDDQEQEQEEQKPDTKPKHKDAKAPSKSEKHASTQAKPDTDEESDDQNQASDQDQSNNEDVTSKVLTGIRKAQELFYQKRYPEALAMVRQSLDAQPTAEGHALAGSISYMMGKSGLARRHWEDALRLNPDMPAVENMLQRTRTPGGRGSPAPRPLISRPSPKPPAAVIEAAGPEISDGAPFPEEATSDNVPIQKFDSEGRLGPLKNSSQPAIAQPAKLVPSPTPTPPLQLAPDIAAEKHAEPVMEKAMVEPQAQTKPEAAVEAEKSAPIVPPATVVAPSKPVFPTKKAKGK